MSKNLQMIAAAAAVVTALATAAIFIVGFHEYRSLKFEQRLQRMAAYGERFDDELRAARTYASRLHPNSPVPGDPAFELFTFFEQMGEAYHYGLITDQDLINHFREPILVYWCGWSEWVDEFRKAHGEDETLWEYFEDIGEVAKENNGGRCLSTVELAHGLSLEAGRETASPEAEDQSRIHESEESENTSNGTEGQ